jgi:hypothetical protein
VDRGCALDSLVNPRPQLFAHANPLRMTRQSTLATRMHWPLLAAPPLPHTCPPGRGRAADLDAVLGAGVCVCVRERVCVCVRADLDAVLGAGLVVGHAGGPALRQERRARFVRVVPVPRRRRRRRRRREPDPGQTTHMLTLILVRCRGRAHAPVFARPAANARGCVAEAAFDLAHMSESTRASRAASSQRPEPTARALTSRHSTGGSLSTCLSWLVSFQRANKVVAR